MENFIDKNNDPAQAIEIVERYMNWCHLCLSKSADNYVQGKTMIIYHQALEKKPWLL